MHPAKTAPPGSYACLASAQGDNSLIELYRKTFLDMFSSPRRRNDKLDITQYPYKGVYEIELVIPAGKVIRNAPEGSLTSIVTVQLRCVAKSPLSHTRLLKFAERISLTLLACGAEFNIRPLRADEVTKMLPYVVGFVGDKDDSTMIVPA